MTTMPQIGEIIYRPYRMFRTETGTGEQVDTLDIRRSNKGRDWVLSMRFDLGFNAWLMTPGPGLLGFIKDEVVPRNLTHCVVTNVNERAVELKAMPSDMPRLRSEFPSVGGWEQGLLHLRTVAAASLDELIELVPEEDLTRYIDREKIMALLKVGASLDEAPSAAGLIGHLDGIVSACRLLSETQDAEAWADLISDAHCVRNKVIELCAELGA